MLRFSRDVAAKIADLRADKVVQDRIDFLAERSNNSSNRRSYSFLSLHCFLFFRCRLLVLQFFFQRVPRFFFCDRNFQFRLLRAVVTPDRRLQPRAGR